jgi:hypothetical protein
MSTYGPNGPVDPPPEETTSGRPTADPEARPADGTVVPPQPTVAPTTPPGYPGSGRYPDYQGYPAPGYAPPGQYQPGYQQPGYQPPGYQQPGYQQPGPPPTGWPSAPPGYPQPGYPQPYPPPAGYPPAGYAPAGYVPPGGYQSAYPAYPPPGYGQVGGGQTPRRNRAVIVLSVILAVLVIAGIAIGIAVSAGTATISAPRPPAANTCVDSNNGDPVLMVPRDCASATYRVVEVVSGTDNTASCSGVDGVTNYYRFTWPPNGADDYVLCLRKQH